MSVFNPTTTVSKPHRQPSFVGLPPISPGPEFGSALDISTADFDAAYDGRRNSPSPPAQSSSPHLSSYLNGRGGNNHNGAGPVSIMSQYHSASPPPQGHYMQGQYVVMQSPQGQHQAGHPYPPGAQFNGNGNGNGNGMHQQPGSPPPGHDGQPGVYMSRQAMKAPASYQQFGSPPGSPPGLQSPSMMSNGQFIVPPGWKMESSQLQQPLTLQKHRPSPSISSLRQQNQAYEIDKETGLSTRSVSPPTQSPVDTRRPGQPALVQSAGQSSQQQNGFAPPNPPFAQQQQQHPGPGLVRTSTNITQDSQHHDEHDGRRTSNMFSTIRSRLAGNGNDRRDSMGSRPQGNGVTGDGVSEASVPSEEQGRGGPSNFFGLRGNSEGAPRGSQDIGGTPSPAGGTPFSPPREKRSFFTRPSGPGTGSVSAQDIRRPSTAEGATSQPPIVGFGPGQPKKRFSKLTGMLNRDNKTESQLSQLQGQATLVQGQRPSFQGQRSMPPGGPMGLPGQMGPPGGPGMGEPQMSDFGRPRSATTGMRPSISDHSRTPSAQGIGSPPAIGAIPEEERGRKPSGNFLAGIFGKRPESRTREQRPPQSPPGLGQPQSMNPQGQMLMMQRPGQQGSFLPIQGQTLGIQGQPMAPPQGQYAGLVQQAQQQQQQFLGQPGRQGMPNNQAFIQGPNPAQFAMNLQRQASPGISPVTQSSESPLTTQPPGGITSQQPPVTQQGQPGYVPQRPQGQPPPLGIVQVATAVPIRQVSNSPNGNTGQLPAGNSPGGLSDSSHQRAASVVNQIDVGGMRKQIVDGQGTRSRAASQSASQQHPVHIAALQTPVRKPVHTISPRNSAQFRQQDVPSDQTQFNDPTASAGQRNDSTPPEGSSHPRRASQGLAPGQQQQQQNVSLQSTPRGSPAPNPEQQSGPPGVPPKNSPAPNQGQGLGLSQSQPWQNPGGASQQSSISQQPSVYRPSGPQIAAVVQSFSQQQPQSPWSIGRQNTTGHIGQPGQPGQQFSSGQSAQSLMMTPPPQDQRPEKEGAFSKLLGKSKTFVYQISDQQPSSDKVKPEKESKGVKGMLGAFKRDRPKQQQQQLPEIGKAPPGGPQWNIQSGQVPPGAQQQHPGQMSQGQQMPQRLPQMQMPPKAQQVMGIGEGEQKIVSTPDQMPQPQAQPVPQSQPQPQAPQGQAHGQSLPGQPRPEHQRTNSQPYLNYQKERQSPPKTSPPFAQQQQQQQSQAQAGQQQPNGRSSIGGPAPNQGVPPPLQHQQQQQHPSQQHPGQHRQQMSANAATMRAQNLKQQIAPHAPEPQYAPVPIPQGYTPVYGDGKPEMMRAASYGQPYPGMPYQGPPQQWVYPGMLPGQVPQGVHPHLVQQGWPQYPPYQGTPPPMTMAQHPPPQQYTQGQQVLSPPLMQGQTPPPQMPMQQPGSQPPMHAQIMAPIPGHVQTAPQQAVSSPQSAAFASPQQGASASFDQMQGITNNGQFTAPQAQQQFAVVPDSAPASVQTSNAGPPQSHSPEHMKLESTQAPNQTVPRSTFAGARPIAEQDQLQPPQDTAGNLVPQRQLSGASEVSSLTSGHATSQGSIGAQSDHTVSQAQVHGGSDASPELAYERPPVTLKDEGARAETPITSTSAEKDDIYGATPRQSVHATPVEPQAHHIVEHVIAPESTIQEHSAEPESKFAGPLPNNRSPESKPTFKVEPPSQQNFVVDAPPIIAEPDPTSSIPAVAASSSSTSSPDAVVAAKSLSPDEEPPSPTESELGKKDKNAEGGEDGQANGKPVQSSAEIFEEHKRKQLLRDMEEKIAINPTEPQMLETRRKKDDDAPMMSATSYPGQEWNPYGDGWVEDEY
ncbi:hypothetical protein VP1G_04392 [Cytospora mali]|uniref:Uncharacterized protein n=1 Tax=Cytospora mali TaxID=578113 RepID=A0A194UZD0_CYTMA|nr:hypothetical protein VP1G_04392 [Valsa mali var. pyri (nom. inval.)]